MSSGATKEGAARAALSIIPEVFAPEGASEKAVEMFNGKSAGSTRMWDFQPGDWIVAQVEDVSVFKARWHEQQTYRLVLLSEEGTECGQPLGHHTHRVLILQHQELRRFNSSCKPAEGDTVALAYHGRDDTHRPSRHIWRYSIDKSYVDQADNF